MVAAPQAALPTPAVQMFTPAGSPASIPHVLSPLSFSDAPSPTTVIPSAIPDQPLGDIMMLPPAPSIPSTPSVAPSPLQPDACTLIMMASEGAPVLIPETLPPLTAVQNVSSPWSPSICGEKDYHPPSCPPPSITMTNDPMVMDPPILPPPKIVVSSAVPDVVPEPVATIIVDGCAGANGDLPMDAEVV